MTISMATEIVDGQKELREPKDEGKRAAIFFNRAPLMPGVLSKLPLGSVTPGGWLSHQLELMAQGLTGRLYEFGPFFQKEKNGWLHPEAGQGWEEVPYWFRGFYPLAVLTRNQRLLEVASRYIDAILGSQDEDGFFGPGHLKRQRGKNGRIVTDIWPHMLLVYPLLHHYEVSADRRVIEFLEHFFLYCLKLGEDFIPPSTKGNYGWGGEDFGDLRPFIQYVRAGDLLPAVYTLYNITGNRSLLALAARIYNHIRPAWDEWLDHHCVNFAQRFAYPAIFSQQSHAAWQKEASEYWYNQHMGTWGQMPGGIFAADERIRPDCTDPAFGHEPCGIIELARSFYILARITGDPVYADRAEEILFNHFPVAYTPDYSAIHYITAANQPILSGSGFQLHRNNYRAPEVSYVGYTPYNRCCGHNCGLGWPNFIENLWQATADSGLVLWMYADSQLSTELQNRRISITTHTGYPFSGDVELTIETDGQIRFPLYLRIPGWCREYTVQAEEIRRVFDSHSGKFVRLDDTWTGKKKIRISMAQPVITKRWPRNGSVSIRRGPLYYSVRIKEKWRKHPDLNNQVYRTGDPDWPNWEVLPESAWNYGLLLDEEERAICTGLEEKPEIPDQPWTEEHTPLAIHLKAKKIADWKLINRSFIEPLQNSPIKSDEPEETITLIPLGCARLRVSCLPVVDDSPSALPWRRKNTEMDPKNMPVNRFDVEEIRGITAPELDL